MLRITFLQVSSIIQQSLGIAPQTVNNTLIPQVMGILSLTPTFLHNNVFLDLPPKTRAFLKDIFDALNFNSLLNLSR